METQPKELGAVALAGKVLYELWEHDGNCVELRHVEDPDQHILIDKEALPGIASIFRKAAQSFESNS
jgi:hypothetical protein